MDSEEEAIRLAEDVKFVHEKPGFEIRNFISNSSKDLQATEPEHTVVNINISPDLATDLQ